jgi:putative membrane protein
MTNYYASHYGGMHMIWWVLWIIFLIWIFAIPYDIPGQRVKKDSPIDILKKRLASGEITNEEFTEKKKFIDS